MKSSLGKTACSDLNLELEPAESVNLTLSWTPVKEGQCTGTDPLENYSGVRAEIVILALIPMPKRTPKGEQEQL